MGLWDMLVDLLYIIEYQVGGEIMMFNIFEDNP